MKINWKNHWITAVLFLITVFTLIANEHYLADKQIRTIWGNWNRAIAQAQRDNLTTQEFFDKYSHVAAIADDAIVGPSLLVISELNNFVCREYSLRVHYSSDGGDGAKLVFISGNGHGLLCFI